MLTLQKFCAFQVIEARMRRNGLLEVYEVYDKLGSFPVCQSSIEPGKEDRMASRANEGA